MKPSNLLNVKYIVHLDDDEYFVRQGKLPFAPTKAMLFLLDGNYRKPELVAWVEKDQLFEVVFEEGGPLIVEEMQRRGWKLETLKKEDDARPSAIENAGKVESLCEPEVEGGDPRRHSEEIAGTEAKETKIKFGTAVRLEREAKGWTVEELATRMSYTVDRVERIEAGTARVTILDIWHVAEALGMRLGVLLERYDL